MVNMKKQLLLAVALASSMWASAQTNPLWMRYSSISPNGQTIAFSYKGDIFTVPVTGGNARQITTNAAYDSYPVWSPDGRKIAFASSREGSLDVYVVNENGGVPTRLTYNSGDEIPMAFSDGMHVLFSSSLMPTAKSIIFASAQFPQVYQVSTEGMARPTLFSGLPMCDVNINSRGDLLYHDQKGYEDPWRKHHTSPITRDIWMKRDGKYSKLTSFNGEDRNAVWGSGDTYYYLSEESGTFNVYRRNIDGSGKQQLTSYKGNPVRFLSRSNDGTLCYGYDGEIYTLREGQQPKKVAVNVVSDRNDIDLDRQTLTRGATEIAVSPSGKEIAFVLHGDVYVTSVEYKTTKQITNTPEQERSIDFAPDGRSIVYASERNGLWQIYQSTIKKKEEKLFTYATEIEEEQLVKSNQTSFQPRYSPDGKSVAYLENRTTLRAVDVKSHALRTLMDGKYMYSYSDGDQWFEWSPDSKWLLSSYIGTGGWNNSDVALVDASGSGVIHDVTESGYNDGDAKWVLGGKAMLFQSDRAGFRSHGSWGSESDAYLMFFDLDAYEQFKMTKEEKGLFDEAKKKDKKDDAKKDEKKPKKVEPLKFDLDNCRDRVIRLTVNSSHMGDAILSPGGDTLYYQASFEGGYDLWRHVIRDGKTEIVAKNIGSGGLKADKNFKNIYLCNSTIKKFDVGKNSSSAISFEARFDYQPYKERRYLFNHVWQQVKDKFYDVNLHGVDWDGYRATYERFLPYINNGYDFRDMLSELLGELNASHTGARFYADGARLKTAVLGLFFDQTYTGDGLKVEEVIKRGPFAVKNTKVQRGSIIVAIDGQRIEAGKAYDMLLDGKAGKPVRVTVSNGGKSFDVTVRPISKSQQDELLYKRWVDRNRAMVDSLSGGRLAYVHVKAMNSESFRTVFSELLSDKNRQKEAVIVDERHNGGGWLHDDLCTLLSGKQYQSFVPRGQFIGYDPWNKWVKPSCVMVCEDDYSNGHGFPFVYKTLGIGKVIGTPVAGTMTAVWWERLMDNQMVFGIPQVGCRDMNGVYGENNTLQPDIEVYNTPEDNLQGNDEQLKRAVELMLKK
uniref:Tricorn protease homolog n=1 Tax=Prevotella sp. GTC17253 TaxID=3236793 RepID=A0AB33IPK8_9BACT